MTLDVSRYLDPDEMAEYDEPEVTGVTTEYPVRFTRASNLLKCEWCGNTGLLPTEVAAVRPRDKAVMMCSECEPNPEEYLDRIESEQRDFEGNEPKEEGHNPEYMTENEPAGENTRDSTLHEFERDKDGSIAEYQGDNE